MAGRFLQFRLSQLLLLFALLSALLVLFAPYLQRRYRTFEVEQSVLKYKQARKDLKQGVQENDVELVKRATAAGFTAEQLLQGEPNPGDGSMLLGCVANGQIAIVDTLLQAGADPNRIGRLPTTTTNSVKPPRPFFSDGPPLFAVIGSQQPTSDRLAMIRLLVRHGADPLKTVQDNAMDVAVRAGDADAADLLRGYGLPYGPREMATFNRLDELKRAVEANPELIKQRYKPEYAAYPGEGPTLLGIAMSHGHREMSIFLIESGAPLDGREYRGESLLHRAARGGDPVLIRMLVSRGADISAQDVYRDTPLHLAAVGGHLAGVVALLEAGADVHARGTYGKTPLYLAAWCNHPEVFEPLVAAGADTSEAVRDLLADASPSNLADWQKSIAIDMARRLKALPSVSGK